MAKSFENKYRLNPCSNGIDLKQQSIFYVFNIIIVLILVILEDGIGEPKPKILVARTRNQRFEVK